MASGLTNRGKKLILGWVFNGVPLPANFYAALCTSAQTPGADTNVMSDLTQIAAGNGYTSGGIALTPNTVDFPNLTEDDVNDRATLRVRNLTWTAVGGNLPSDGIGARWMVLTTDEAVVADRQIIAYFDLAADRIVSDTQELQVNLSELRFLEP